MCQEKGFIKNNKFGRDSFLFAKKRGRYGLLIVGQYDRQRTLCPNGIYLFNFLLRVRRLMPRSLAARVRLPSVCFNAS